MARAVIANILGAKGPKGDKGDIGNTGPQGGQGVAGPIGPQGVPGTTGQAIDTVAAIGVKRTNLATNPSFESASGTVTVRTNLFTNPSATTANSWGCNVPTGLSGSTVTVMTGGGPSGGPNTYVRQSFSAGGTSTQSAGFYNPSIPVTANGRYSVSRWVRFSQATTVKLGIDWRDSGGAVLSSSYGSPVAVAANTWTLLTSSGFTAPANATTGAVTGYGSGNTWTGSDTFDSTGLMFENTLVVGPFFDGSTAASGDYTYSWASTANNSVSYQKGIALTGTIAGGSLATAYQSSDWSNSRGKSMRITPAGASDPNSYAFVGGDGGGIRLGMVAGGTYTVTATCRLAAPQTGTLSGWARSIAFFYKLNGTYSTVLSAAAPNTAGSARVSVTVTIPAGSTEAFVRLMNGALQGGGDVWWDDITVERTALQGPYFDGNSPGAYWTGSVDASTSVAAAFGNGLPDATKVLLGDGTWGLKNSETTLANNVDFNTVTTSGVYMVLATPTGANYPCSASGILEVWNRGGGGFSMQEYTPVWATASSNGRSFYRRFMLNGTWSAWQFFGSYRVDQTAGRAVYSWDPLNSREQLTYGDTGVRAIDSILNAAAWDTSGATRTLRLRRVGSTVSLQGQVLSIAALTNGTKILDLPSGFRQEGMIEMTALHAPSGKWIRYSAGNSYGAPTFYWDTSAVTFGSGQVAQMSLTWLTTDPWPTSLPGSAIGTIPNT